MVSISSDGFVKLWDLSNYEECSLIVEANTTARLTCLTSTVINSTKKRGTTENEDDEKEDEKSDGEKKQALKKQKKKQVSFTD